MQSREIIYNAVGGVARSAMECKSQKNEKFKGRWVAACEVIEYLTAAVIFGGSIGGIVTYQIMP